MTSPEHLPSDYTPYQVLTVCSNKLVNTLLILEVDGHAPLLVGAGAIPRIWLSVPTSRDGQRWAMVVRDSKPVHPRVEVTLEHDKSILVTAVGKRILRVLANDETSATISELDLRPMGINVHGNADTLWIGTNQLSNNTFENVRAAVGIGEQRTTAT